MTLRKLTQLSQLALATDERGELRHEIRRADRGGTKGRERVGQVGDLELIDALRPGQVPEPMLTQVPQRHPALIREHFCRGLGNEHLAAVTRRRNTRAQVNTDAHVPLAGVPHLRGMNAHADQDRLVCRPRLGCEIPLGLLRRQHGIAGPAKRHQE